MFFYCRFHTQCTAAASIDPLAEKYAYQSTYQFSSNQPIHAPELEGLESRNDLTLKETTNSQSDAIKFIENQQAKNNIMKNYRLYPIFIMLSYISCTGVKTVYTKNELYPNSYPIKEIFEKLEAGTQDKSIIVFTSWFEKDVVEIRNGDNIVF